MALTLVTVADGVELFVRVTPRAAKSRIAGEIALPDGRTALALRLRAPPVDGAANAELTAVLAKMLEVRRTDIHILAGDTARVKRIGITGAAAVLGRKLAALTEAG